MNYQTLQKIRWQEHEEEWTPPGIRKPSQPVINLGRQKVKAVTIVEDGRERIITVKDTRL